jgi:hypothetical protein
LLLVGLRPADTVASSQAAGGFTRRSMST